MESVIAWAAMVIGGGVTLAVITWTQVEFRIRRKKLTSIASLTEGKPGRIAGTVKQLGDLIEAGATGRPCVLYRVEILRYLNRPGESASKTIAVEVRGVPFVIADATGTAVVDPNGAKVGSLRCDAWSDLRTFTGPTPRTDAILARHGHPNPDPAWKRRLVVSEAIVVPGDRLEVHGAGVRDAAPGAEGNDYRTAGTRVHLVGSAKSELWIVKPD